MFGRTKSATSVPDFELDRGISPRDQEIETLSEEELVTFSDPQHPRRFLTQAAERVSTFFVSTRESKISLASTTRWVRSYAATTKFEDII